MDWYFLFFLPFLKNQISIAIKKLTLSRLFFFLFLFYFFSFSFFSFQFLFFSISSFFLTFFFQIHCRLIIQLHLEFRRIMKRFKSILHCWTLRILLCTMRTKLEHQWMPCVRSLVRQPSMRWQTMSCQRRQSKEKVFGSGSNRNSVAVIGPGAQNLFARAHTLFRN